MSSTGYLADVPKLCFICNKIFTDSIQQHVETNEEHHTETRWDYARLDKELSIIKKNIKKRNTMDEYSNEKLIQTAERYKNAN